MGWGGSSREISGGGALAGKNLGKSSTHKVKTYLEAAFLPYGRFSDELTPGVIRQRRRACRELFDGLPPPRGWGSCEEGKSRALELDI